MPLKDVTARTAKPANKAYKLADEKSMFLMVYPNGTKCWRFKYRFEGKEKVLALGTYPEVSLAEARQKRDEARQLLTNNVDPGKFKQQSKRSGNALAENSFEYIAREWHTKNSVKWSARHAERIMRRIEVNILPSLGKKQITQISAAELLAVLRKIESRGAIDITHRLHQNCSQIFRYAIATARAERDPAHDLRGAFTPLKNRHHASLTDPKAVGELMRAIEGYSGYLLTKYALQLSPLVFVRPGELRHAEWAEFNFAEAEWRIPASKMKMKITHIVPLSEQAISILKDAQKLTGSGKYVFPSSLSPNRPMSENTVNAALRRLGFTRDEMTAHGFRSTASTLLNELGWNGDAIERQLAHAESNNIRAAYNYAEYLPKRRKMMQFWSDYLQSLMTETPKPTLDAYITN